MSPANNSRFNALTGVRWLFASLVFIYHNRKYWRTDVPPLLLRWMNEMHIGVALFFVLSGFLIAYRYNHTNQPSNKSYLHYLLLRCARILPLYWMLLLISYLDIGFPTWPNTLYTFTLVHGFSNQLNLDGISQAWSLNVEICFYLLAPWLFVWWNRRKWKALLLCLLLLGTVYGIGLIWHAINGNQNQWLYPFDFLLQATFAGRFPEFFAGIYLAGIVQGTSANPFKKIPHITAVGATGLIGSMLLISCFEPDIFHHGYDTIPGAILQYTLIPFFAIAWLYGLMVESTWLQRFLASKPLVLLGNASFAFYLIHISYVNTKIRHWVLMADRNYCLLWLLAIGLYLCFEKPIYQLCSKQLQRWRFASVAAKPKNTPE